MLELIEPVAVPGNAALSQGKAARVIALEFRPGFEHGIRAGTKLQALLRAVEDYEIAPVTNDQVIAWVSTSTVSMKIVREATLIEVLPVHIDVHDQEPIFLDGEPLNRKQLERFARAEGFNTYHQLRLYLMSLHGERAWNGVLIKWEV